jgi:aminopeptidase N
LVTYRETALLIDPQFSSMDSRQRVAIVVAHELAHQWFGNLVVCRLVSNIKSQIKRFPYL